MSDYYECQDCYYYRIDSDTGEAYCKRTYASICEDSNACDCFVEDND